MVTLQQQQKKMPLQQPPLPEQQQHQQQQQSYYSKEHHQELQQKAEEINLVLLQPDVDLWRLRELAISEGGLVNDTLRKRAWPKLVGLHKYYKYKPHFYKPKPQTGQLYLGSMDAPKFEFDTSAMVIVEKEDLEGMDCNDPSSFSGGAKEKEDPLAYLICQSMDAEQIERDVTRCTWHLLSGTQRSRRVQYHNKHRKKVSSLLRRKQRRLANLINLTLVESYELAPSVEDRLRYYQGYHDVACIFLHALGGGNSKPENNSNHGDDDNNNNNNNNATTSEEDKLGLELPARVLCQVSYSHFRDHLRSDFMSLQTALRVALFPLLAKLDRPVHDHLKDCDMEPFFCLSWVLTWFAHDVRDTELVKRLFDVFLCSHPLFSLYVAVAMLVHPINRQVILSTDCDFAALHQCLVTLPRNSCRVGWKRRCDGEGYVSDEEDTAAGGGGGGGGMDDNMTASTGMDSSTNTFWDYHQEERSMSLATSASIVNSSSIAGTASSMASSLHSFSVGPIVVEDSYDRVPFQELIEQGLAYMRRFPPRCLLNLAKDYFKEQWHIGEQVSNISLLQNPPTWSLASTAKADWVLKQRVRQDLGLKATSRKDRRKKLKFMQQLESNYSDVVEDSSMTISTVSGSNNGSGSGGDSSKKKMQPTEEATPLVDMEYLKKHQNSLAVIAVGYGPDPVDPEKKKRKKQMRMAVAVVVAAIFVGFVYRRYQLRSSSTNTSTSTTTPVVTDSTTTCTSTSYDKSNSNDTGRSGGHRPPPPSSSSSVSNTTGDYSSGGNSNNESHAPSASPASAREEQTITATSATTTTDTAMSWTSKLVMSLLSDGHSSNDDNNNNNTYVSDPIAKSEVKAPTLSARDQTTTLPRAVTKEAVTTTVNTNTTSTQGCSDCAQGTNGRIISMDSMDSSTCPRLVILPVASSSSGGTPTATATTTAGTCWYTDKAHKVSSMARNDRNNVYNNKNNNNHNGNHHHHHSNNKRLATVLSNHPAIVIVKKTTQTLLRMMQHFQYKMKARIWMPLIRTLGGWRNHHSHTSTSTSNTTSTTTSHDHYNQTRGSSSTTSGNSHHSPLVVLGTLARQIGRETTKSS